jgi:hypothetical protein
MRSCWRPSAPESWRMLGCARGHHRGGSSGQQQQHHHRLGSLLLLLVTTACSSSSSRPGSPAAAPPTQRWGSNQAKRFEPGGWGAFLGLARHPSNPAVWLAGADVGGLFVTRDDARSWHVCNTGLATKWVYAVEFVDENTPLLATTNGVYRGQASAAAGPCIWAFTLSNDGLQLSNTTLNTETSAFKFRHAVRVLHTSSSATPTVSSTRTVWAGIGVAKNRATFDDGARRGDPYHVYMSADLGRRWRGVLTLPQGAGQVLSIRSGSVNAGGNALAPKSGTSTQVRHAVFITTAAAGAYVTEDHGRSWVEIGVSPAMVTKNSGRSWASCGSGDSFCPPRFRKPCRPPGGNSTNASCLPINAQQSETHPNTASVVVAAGKVFVTVFDTAEASEGLLGPCQGGATTRPDPMLRQYRGGPWMSQDGGRSFVQLFRVHPFRGASLRCPGVSCHYSTPNVSDRAAQWPPIHDSHAFAAAVLRWLAGSRPAVAVACVQYPNMEVDPADPSHLFLGGWGSAGPGQGITELVDGHWVYWDWCGGSDGSDRSCFEGERPDSMAQDWNTYTFAMGVDWRSAEQRVITNGQLQPFQKGGTQQHALVRLGLTHTAALMMRRVRHSPATVPQ